MSFGSSRRGAHHPPLISAALRGDAKAISSLIAHGAANALHENNETALMIACSMKSASPHRESLVLLVDRLLPETDFSLRNARGKTAFEIAVSTQNWHFVDAMSSAAEPKEMRDLREMLGPEQTQRFLPRWSSRQEAALLAQIAGLSDKSGTDASFPDPAATAQLDGAPAIERAARRL